MQCHEKFDYWDDLSTHLNTLVEKLEILKTSQNKVSPIFKVLVHFSPSFKFPAIIWIRSNFYSSQFSPFFTFSPYYTVYRLEVTFLKLLERIEKWIKFYIQCFYLKEYKKGFAFLTKFYYFESRGGLRGALKMQLKISGQTIGLTLNVFF